MFPFSMFSRGDGAGRRRRLPNPRISTHIVCRNPASIKEGTQNSNLPKLSVYIVNSTNQNEIFVYEVKKQEILPFSVRDKKKI